MDLFDKMEQMDIKKNKANSKTKELKFEITGEENELLLLIKKIVNERDYEYNDMYEKFGRQLGWNMIDSARKGQISWERFKKWMDFLEMEIDLSVKEK